MNQSKLKANTFNRHQAQENTRKQDTVGFSYASDWQEKVARDFLANHKP